MYTIDVNDTFEYYTMCVLRIYYAQIQLSNLFYYIWKYFKLMLKNNIEWKDFSRIKENKIQ